MLAAVGYGVIHDQVTARICIEYFTVAHPPIFPATSPTILGLCWGIAAAAPVGLVLGILLARASRAGDAPPVPAAELTRPVAALAASGLRKSRNPVDGALGGIGKKWGVMEGGGGTPI
jgi:hypothetical protein